MYLKYLWYEKNTLLTKPSSVCNNDDEEIISYKEVVHMPSTNINFVVLPL